MTSSPATSTRSTLSMALGASLVLAAWGIYMNMQGMSNALYFDSYLGFSEPSLDQTRPSGHQSRAMTVERNTGAASTPVRTPMTDLLQQGAETTTTSPVQQTASPPTVPLFSNRTLLTIAVDNYVSCPEKCIFAHTNLPPWVQYRYIDFNDQNDLAVKDDNSTHLLLVVRTNIILLSQYAKQRKQNHPDFSVGMWHMADERFYKGEIIDTYERFDYVLRHYYRSDFYGMTLRALGNITCGDSPPLPSTNPKDPKWGVHWVHLDAHGMSTHMIRSHSSIWPSHKRPTNCSFIGRGDVKRSIGERKQMSDAVALYPDLHCHVEITRGFAAGDGPFTYYNYKLANSKIGLSPRGSAIETHRLAEILRMGAVPALKDEEYLHATFVELPGIIAKNWTLVAQKMQYYLVEAPDELELLARKSAKFSNDLHNCVVGDMDYILRKAFGIDRDEKKAVASTSPSKKAAMTNATVANNNNDKSNLQEGYSKTAAR